MSLNLTSLGFRERPDQAPEPQDDKTLIVQLETKYSEAERTQRDQERMWKETIAMMAFGAQWIRSDQYRMLNVAGVTGRGRQRLTYNMMKNHARRLHARLDQVKYAPAVTSDTDDPGDAEAAKSANGAVRWFYRRKKIQQLKRRANWWIIACGFCYVQPFYDPMAGEMKPMPKLAQDGRVAEEQALDDAGQPVFDPVYDDEGNPALEAPADPVGASVPKMAPRMRPVMELRTIGDWDLAVRSPFQVKRDPRFQEWEKLRWIILEEGAAREEVADRFRAAIPDVDEKLPTDQRPTKTMPWMPEVSGMTSDYTGIPKPPPGVGGVLTVKRYYERPSAKHPEGREVIWTGSMKLHEGPLGTPDGDFPLVPVGYLAMPFVLESQSPLQDVKGLQRAANRILSRYWEHLIRLHIGWLLVPSTSGIPKNAFTNDIAPVIRFAPGGGAPQFVFPPLQGLAWYEKFMDRIEHAFEEAMALPPAARGQMPKGARAFRTLELLKESADEVQAPVLNEQADSWVIVYEKLLLLMDRHASVSRMLAYVGEDKLAATVEWKQGLLPRDWRDRLRVQVEAGESLPSTGQGRREFTFDMVKVGAFGDPKRDPQFPIKLRDAMDLGPGFIPNDQDLDITIAQRENWQMLKSGAAVRVSQIDDDLVHLREHTTFAKRLVVAGREGDAEERLLPHIRDHIAARQQKMAGAKGGPGAGSEPEKPDGTPPGGR